MWFHTDNLVLTLLQALCVALPAAGLPAWLERARRGAWALVLPLSIVVCIAAISLVPASADVYTWLALIGVPIGAAVGFGWAAHGARPPLALLAVPLFILAWTAQDTRVGQLLAGSGPLALVKVALVAMAAIDAYLVFSGELAAPNATLVAAVPAPGLPSLQAGAFGFSSLGYGDFLAAGVLGGIVATERGPQWLIALAVLVVSLAWDQLFLVVDLLPATVPPALVLLAIEARRAVGMRRLQSGKLAATR